MSTFLDRILFNGRRDSTGAHVEKPVAPNPDLAFKESYGAVTMHPLVRIGIYPGVVSYEDDQPLIAPDGGILPEGPKDNWSQLYRAGRLYG